MIKNIKEVKFSKHLLNEVLKHRTYLSKKLITKNLRDVKNLYKSETQSKNKYKLT